MRCAGDRQWRALADTDKRARRSSGEEQTKKIVRKKISKTG